MALKINNIYGVICMKGEVSSSHTQEVRGYFKALLSIQDSVIINLCEVKEGREQLTKILEGLKSELNEEQSLDYYSYPGPAVEKLYEQLNNPANFYQTAA
jgi:hypothetical protein